MSKERDWNVALEWFLGFDPGDWTDRNSWKQNEDGDMVFETSHSELDVTFSRDPKGDTLTMSIGSLIMTMDVTGDVYEMIQVMNSMFKAIDCFGENNNALPVSRMAKMFQKIQEHASQCFDFKYASYTPDFVEESYRLAKKLIGVSGSDLAIEKDCLSGEFDLVVVDQKFPTHMICSFCKDQAEISLSSSGEFTDCQVNRIFKKSELESMTTERFVREIGVLFFDMVDKLEVEDVESEEPI